MDALTPTQAAANIVRFMSERDAWGPEELGVVVDNKSVLARIGVDLGAPQGDRTVGTVCIVDEQRAMADAMKRNLQARLRAVERTPPKLTNPQTDHEQRAMRERAVAVAIAQPQGLGLLFAGLRPKDQR